MTTPIKLALAAVAAVTVGWASPAANAAVYVSTSSGHHHYHHRDHYRSSRVVVLEDRPHHHYYHRDRDRVIVGRSTIAFGGHGHRSHHHHD